HVDITRAEIADAVNTLNLLAAPLIALTANSSVYAGRPGHYLSGREGLLGALGADRAGMTPRAFVSVEEFVAYICHYPCYVLRRGGGFREYNRPFTEYLRRHGPDIDAYLWHEHYTWNSARPRAHTSTMEIRPACQQPHDASLVVAALGLGWVEALGELRGFLADAVTDPWATLRQYRRAAIVQGLRATEPVKGFQAGRDRRGRRRHWLGLSPLAAVVVPACVSVADGETGPGRLVAGARAEGQLAVSSRREDCCGYGDVINGYKQQYGLRVKG